MKIYFIGQKGIPAKQGGVERHAEELAVRLVRAGHEVFVYTRPNYTKASLKKYKGINLISIPSIGTKHLDAISHTFRACLDVIKKDADIIHFHSIGPSSLIWLVKLFKPGIPIISTFHTRCYTHSKWGVLARTCLRIAEAIACLMADKTIAVSESLGKYASEKYGVKTYYLPNGVAIPQKTKPKEIKKWGLEKDNYILIVSRLVRHKGIHYLIEAYKKLRTNKKLVIVGAGAFTDNYVWEIKELAANNKNIIFTGEQTGRALSELFSNAYLFVQPSESEGLSVALLEAMAYEKCVLVSDIPENKEAIDEVGFTFKNKDSEDLKKQLLYLFKRKTLVEKIGKLGRIRAREFYNWSDITKNTLKLYREVLKEKQASSFKIFKLKTVKKFMSFLF